MASWDVTHLSNNTGNALNSGVSIDNTRRLFNFGEKVAKIEPKQTLFYSYLSQKARRLPTDDKVFKMLEQRHQWQRRNFEMYADVTPGTEAYGTALDAGDDFYLCCKYDKYGRVTTTNQPCNFILPGQVLAIKGDDGNVYRFLVSKDALLANQSAASFSDTGTATTGDVIHFTDTDDSTGYTFISGEALTPIGGTGAVLASVIFEDGNKGEVIGTSWAEATGAPEGWSDDLYDREGYTQIWKTAIKLMSGTAMATKHRGTSDEYKRQWMEKLKEHKMDIEKSLMFSKGVASAVGTTPQQTWGILPFVETFSNNTFDYNYADFGYDGFMDQMQEFFAPELGNSNNKLVLASRKVINAMNKLGTNGFLHNTVGADSYKLDVQTIKGKFGHRVTQVDCIFGYLNFVEAPLLRGPWEDYALIVDMSHVYWRPLIGNGHSRDTFIKTNIQEADIDGRKDMILTEGGLQIDLPETHGLMKWS